MSCVRCLICQAVYKWLSENCKEYRPRRAKKINVGRIIREEAKKAGCKVILSGPAAVMDSYTLPRRAKKGTKK